MTKLFNWRDEIRKTDLPPTTRLVLFNLSFYMNGYGENCYPSLSRQEGDTGLSRRAIIFHIKEAERKGFLKVEKSKEKNAKWEHNKYHPSLPEGSAGDAPLVDKVVTLTTQGGYPDDTKGVQEGNTTTSYNNTNIIQSEFLAFYEAYGKKKGKGSAKKAYIKARTKLNIPAETILLAAKKQYASFKKEGNFTYMQWPASWLNDEGWDNDYGDIKIPEESKYPFGVPIPKDKRDRKHYFEKYELVYGKECPMRHRAQDCLPEGFLKDGLTKKEREGK